MDLAKFDLNDMIECGRAVRKAGEAASSMEEAAGEIIQLLRRTLVDGQTGEANCPLIRCFKTHPLSQLPPDLEQIAQGSLSDQRYLRPDLPYLTLLATAGDAKPWNDRRSSRGHAAIPLESMEMVERAPMIASLLRQKLALLPFVRGAVFASAADNARLDRNLGRAGEIEQLTMRSEIATLHLLISALEEAALRQTKRLKSAYGELQIQGSWRNSRAREKSPGQEKTTKQSVGTGLGLWVTKGIVEKHGGSIRFRSRVQPPCGTVFRIVLPRRTGGLVPDAEHELIERRSKHL